MPVQFEYEAMTSYMVLFTVEDMISGTDFELRFGNEERVETQRSL